jgi:hypothetical protein
MIGMDVREKDLADAGPANLSQTVGYPVPAIKQQDFRTGNHQ